MHGLGPWVLRGALALAAMFGVATAAIAQTGDHASPRLLVDMGSAAPDGVFPRSVRHMFGETVLEVAPQRIIVISTGQLDAAITLGIVPVGATAGDNADIYPAYLGAAFPQHIAAMAEVANLGDRSGPNLELIAQLRPDLIFMNQAVLQQDFFDTLSQIAPVVVTRGNGVNWKVDYLLLAQALGKGGEAQAFLDQFHADADAFAANLPADPPSVSLLQSTGARTRVMGVTSLGGGILQDLGLSRPQSQQFDKNSEDISLELLDLADADWIFYGTNGTGDQALQNAALWPSLSAVAADRAVAIDFDAFYLNTGPTAARVVLDTVIETLSE